MVSVETERWTVKHSWRFGGRVYTSMPPKFDYSCSRCGETAIAEKPPDTECPGIGRRSHGG